MGSVVFYLKPANKSGKSLIVLQFKYQKQRLLYSFGESIEAEKWSQKKQRVKYNSVTTADGEHSLNDLLKNLEDVCINAYNKERVNGVPSPLTLKKHLDDFRFRNLSQAEQDKNRPTLLNLIDRFIRGEIKGKGGRQRAQGSLDNYAACKAHLEAFQAKYRYRVDFDTITLDFFERYTTFLEKEYTYKSGKNILKGLSRNTIAKDITYLKTFLNKAVSLGYTQNLQFKHRDFSYTEEETDAVYLKEDEIVDLFRFKSSNSKLERTKDLFVAGCFLGLRFSDYSNVEPENIIEEDGDPFIKIQTQKTREWVYIPCHPVVQEIFVKYKNNPNRLPKTLSNQKFNEYIKEACKEAGLTQKGRLSTDLTKPLYECVSSHTARRSFATNLFLQGFPPEEIMKITGHKERESFDKYIRLTKLDSAKRLNAHMKQMWSKKINHLKVV